MTILTRTRFALTATAMASAALAAPHVIAADTHHKHPTVQYQKPGAPVSLGASALQAQPGDTLQATAQLRLHSSVDAVTVRLTSADMDLLSPAAVSLGATPASAIDVPITVYAPDAGLHYVNVLVETQVAGHTESRALALPIQVGDAPAKMAANGVQKTTASGRAVISMPAQETIAE